MTNITYENREIETTTVEKIEGHSVHMSSGWATTLPEEVRLLVKEGDEIVVESRSSIVTGWMIDGEWIIRKSDQELEAERRALIARWEQQKIDRLEENHEEWSLREKALPDWIRARIEGFHQTGGEHFLLEGWGYELIVAELAVMYYDTAPEFEDSPAIIEYADKEGTSGNQHSIAKLLARTHYEEGDYSLANTPSALTSLTGDPFYQNSSKL